MLKSKGGFSALLAFSVYFCFSQTTYAQEPSPVILGLEDFVRLTAANSDEVQIQRLDTGVAKTAVDAAEAIFEPVFVPSVRRGRTFVDNSLDTRGDLYNLDNQALSLGVEFLTPIGTQASVAYVVDDNRKRDLVGARRPNYQDSAGIEFTLTQPLLKDAGYVATMSGIRVAEIEHSIARQQERHTLSNVVLRASQLYYDLQLAQERVRVRREAGASSRQFAGEIRGLVGVGMMGQADLLDAEAAASLRQAQTEQAEQDVVIMHASARNLLYPTGGMGPAAVAVMPRGSLERAALPSVEDLLAAAERRRPEIKATQEKVVREEARVRYSENQNQPELNLVSGSTVDDSFAGSRLGWYVGLEARIPLMGNQKGKANEAAARLRRHQAELEHEAARMTVANNVRSLATQESMLFEQVTQYRAAIESRQGLLDVERARLREGRSSVRDVLRQQEELLQLQEALADRWAAYQKSVLALDFTAGGLLDRFNLEVASE